MALRVSYCLEHTCQIKEQLMHLIFNYCLVLQTPGECQKEQSCLGENENWNLLGKGVKKNRDKICIGYYSSLFSRLTIQLQNLLTPTLNNLPFFSSSRKSQQLESCRSRHRVQLVFIYLHDWCGQVWSTLSSFLCVILPLTDSDRKEGAWHAFLAQREMFVTKVEHSGSHISHQAHEQHIWKVDWSFPTSWDSERTWGGGSISTLGRIIWRTW